VKHIITRYVCQECHGSNVHIDGWFEMNTSEDAGGEGPVGTQYCVDCDSETCVEEVDVEIELCGSCEFHKWGTSIPLAGLLISSGGFVERCDECGIYPSDRAAAESLAREVDRRVREEFPEGGVDRFARIRFSVDGYESEGTGGAVS
jgi:hypothetical protein